MYRVGVDTGGTFTDVGALDIATGDIQALKVPSVPADPARAVVNGRARLRERYGIAAAAVERFIFGTTVATNAILERKGGRTALIATRGTRDVIEIQRQWRHRLFDLALQRPEPLVPRRWRLEASERVAADGSVVVPLDAAEARRVAAEAAALALGMLMTDVKYTRVTTRVLAAADAHGAAVEEIYRDLEAGLTEALRVEGIPPDRMLLARSCDMRYHGQAYEVNVPVAGAQGGRPTSPSSSRGSTPSTGEATGRPTNGSRSSW
jgi:N-methylhydantoinase A/oxoprolinase/acetone carboxylase beta subunit